MQQEQLSALYYQSRMQIWETVSPKPKKLCSVAAAVVPVNNIGQIYVTGGIDLATMEAADEVYTFNTFKST